MRTSTFRLTALALLLDVQLGAPGLAAQENSDSADRGERLSVLSGVVTDHETGQPVSGATVSLIPGLGTGTSVATGGTGDDGGFRFQDLRPGAYRITVSRLGYRVLVDSLSVPAGSEVSVRAELSTLPIGLDPITVVVRRRRADVIPGLQAREHRGVGRILTRERIEATKALHVSDVLRIVPGLRLVPEDDLGYTVRLRDGCRPAIWIDGARTHGINVDAVLLPDDLEAIEVYQAGEIPPQFGQDPCGAVVFWTRTRRPGTGKTKAWKRIVLSAVILAAIFWRFH